MWDLKHRPLTFSDVLGQRGTVQVLKARLRNGSALDTNYIFSGGSGQGKCVVGDTLVSTDLGLVPIRMLMGPNQIDPSQRQVLQECGVSHAAYSYRGGVRRTIRVRTCKGFELEGTPNHRILTLDLDGKVTWCRLDKLTLGAACCLLPMGLFGKGVDLPLLSGVGSDTKEVPFPRVLTPNLGRLFGYIVGGEAWYCESDVIEDQAALCKEAFGSLLPASLPPLDHPQVRDFFQHCGVRHESRSEVPWAILQSPKSVVREFLRGLLEVTEVSQSDCTFSFETKKLAQQVHLLLLQFGVLSWLSDVCLQEGEICWNLRIWGEPLITFQSEIGFVSDLWQQRLSDLVSEVKQGLGSEPTATSSQYSNLVYDCVTSLHAGEAEVFDLNVPEGERFAANGFINHNTTLARIFARALLCQNLDKSDPEPCNKCSNCTSILNDSSKAFIEQDAASQGNIEQVRRIVEDLPFAVFEAPKRIYLFDECHRMSKDAQDVLLKPLEERKLLGMFCTTEPEKVRGAIRSRCEEYTIRKVTREDILDRMKRILQAENVEYEDDGVMTVIDFCGGHVRDVVNRLEMVSQTGPITLDSVREYLNLSVVSIYYDILLRLPTDTRGALELVDRVCDRVTPEEVASGLAESAMNSFRLANGMAADFMFTDRVLGQKVSSLYGNQLIKVAEYFLRSRHTTQVSLVCDIVSVAQQLAGGQVVSVPVVAPKTFQPIAIAPSSAPEQEAGSGHQAGPVAPSVAPVAAPSVAPPVVVPSVTSATPPVAPTGLRPDGLGNLGSSDRAALTEVDLYVISEGPLKKRKGVEFSPGNRSGDGRDILPSFVWAKEFRDLWLRGGIPSVN